MKWHHAFGFMAKIPFIGPILLYSSALLGMGYVGKADDMFSPGGGSGYGIEWLQWCWYISIK